MGPHGRGSEPGTRPRPPAPSPAVGTAPFPSPAEVARADITDQVRFNTVPAFLRHLPDRAEQAAVLRRRLDFLETPASFFSRDGEPVRAEEADDLFRQGMLRVARAAGRAEREWLREALGLLSQPS